MVRKVTEISLSWQRKAFKTTSRLCSAEQGVEDVLGRGVGTGSSVLGSFSGGSGNLWEVHVAWQHRAVFSCCAPCHAAAPSPGGIVLWANRGCPFIR